MAAAWVIVILLILALVFLFSAVKVAREYERGVVFRLGRLIGIKGPGLFILIPLVDKAVKVDLRTITLNVPPQEVITKDNVTVKVNAVAYFRVVDASKAIVQVENYLVATSQIAQTTLRSVLGQVDLDQLLSERDQINDRLQTIIDEQTHPWGVKVSVVEVQGVERRAKIIAADGEYQASEKLSQAAAVIRAEPGALQLRYLQTMNEIGTNERTTTLILPFPVEMLEALTAYAARAGGNGAPGPGNGGRPG
jgi:regulator of protease activity HflC (stomatin/prohibitin superfamily)